ncbi:TPA: hypothetical protein HA278_06260, partial [Candidatus Woesearchaeota archaeon]|nr:hypothetical protein [Candidatus Woesearchaeota archaeon]
LTDLQEIKLEVREFKGNIHVAKHAEFSLDGTARQIDVNGVGLHSGKEMKISLRDLDFNALHIKEIVLNNLQLPQGSGSLKVTDKLSYTLEDDSMGIYYFKGDVDITEGSSDAFVLEGEARGISANGDVLSLNLR